jgi:predicted secreted protein
MKDSIMNSKLLFAATIAVSLLSTSAMADGTAGATAPLTRKQVNADLAKSIANGTLQRTDCDAEARDAAAVSNTSSAQIQVALADAKASGKCLVGLDAKRSYHLYGTEIYKPSIVTRAEMKFDVLNAAANGTQQRTDYDDATLVARRANAHVASSKFAQRAKAFLTRLES